MLDKRLREGVERQSMGGRGNMERWGEAAGKARPSRDFGGGGKFVWEEARPQDKSGLEITRNYYISYILVNQKETSKNHFHKQQACLKYYNEEKCADRKTWL